MVYLGYTIRVDVDQIRPAVAMTKLAGRVNYSLQSLDLVGFNQQIPPVNPLLARSKKASAGSPEGSTRPSA